MFSNATPMNFHRIAAPSLGVLTSLLALVLLTAMPAARGQQRTPPPTIITQPGNQTASAGATVTFRVGASGVGPLTYQWQFNGTNISGVQSDTLVKANVRSADAGEYRVIVSNAGGPRASVGAILTVLIPPAILTEPQDQIVTEGAMVTFSVQAQSSYAEPLQFQWTFRGTNLAGATGSNLVLRAASQAQDGEYRAIVWSKDGTNYTREARLTVLRAGEHPPPTISVQPRSQTVLMGGSATFSVTAQSPDPLEFQWRFNGFNLRNRTNDTLQLTAVTLASAGDYTVLVKSIGGTNLSVSAHLTVYAAATNDAFANRVTIPGINAIVHGHNLGATKEPDEPNHRGNAGGNSVWWTWTAPADGPTTINIAGSSFDAAFGVYTGNTLDSLSAIGTAYDPAGGNYYNQTTFQAAKNTAYHIAVDGYSFNGAVAMGEIVLRVLQTTPPTTQITQPASGAQFPVEKADGQTNVTVLASAEDRDGTIAEVEFTLFEIQGQQTNVVKTSPYRAVFTNLTAGNYYLRAMATDNLGAIGYVYSDFRVLPPPPANDQFANRIAIAGTNRVTGHNFSATKEPGEPSLHASLPGGNSAWWTWIAPWDGPTTISSGESGFSSLVGVYTGETVDSLVPVASALPEGGESGDQIGFVARKNTAYQINVEGYAYTGADGTVAAAGLIVLKVLRTTPPTVRITEPDNQVRIRLDKRGEGTNVTIAASAADPDGAITTVSISLSGGESYRSQTITNGLYQLLATNLTSGYYYITVTATDDLGAVTRASRSFQILPPPPANDEFEERIFIPNFNHRVTGASRGATKQPGEPDHGGNQGGGSVWWTWTAPADGPITINTVGSSFNTLLSVYTGTGVGALTRVAGTDFTFFVVYPQASQFSFQARKDVPYQIAVDGYNFSDGADSGDIVLNVLETARPTVQILQPAGNAMIRLDRSDGQTNVTVLGSASDTDGSIKEVQFSMSGPRSYLVTNIVAGSPYQATFTNLGAGTYSLRLLAVDNAGAVNSAFMNVRVLPPPPANDDFAGRIVIPRLGQVAGSNLGATKQPGEPNHGGNQGGSSVWWSWTAAADGSVTVSTIGSSFNALLGLYTGDTVGSLSPVLGTNLTYYASYPQISQFSFLARKDTPYHIAVDGSSFSTAAESGNIILQIIQTAPPSVRITQPAGNARIHLERPDGKTNVLVVANASDTDGSIKLVQFSISGPSLYVPANAVFQAPYEVTFANLSVGAYYLTAMARDNLGAFGVANTSFEILPPGPSNDAFADRIPLGNTNVVVTGSNLGAAKEPGEGLHAGNSGGSSVWWTWTAPTNGPVTINTLGSSFNTLLNVYTGTNIGTLTRVAQNDDLNVFIQSSQVSFAAQQDTAYHIAVDGYNFGGQPAAGDIVLRVLQTAPPTVQLTQPLNNASFIVDRVGERTNLTAAASANDTDGSIALVQFWLSGPVFRTNAAASSPFQTVFTDLVIGDYSLTALAFDNDGAVKASTSRNVRILPPRPVNDNFTNRIEIGSVGQGTTYNTSASKEPGEPLHAGNAGGRSVWWTWTALQDGPVIIDTIGSDFDTSLAVYTGSTLTSLTRVASDDDSGGNQKSRVLFRGRPGTVYQIAVDGWLNDGTTVPGSGNVTLNVLQVPPPIVQLSPAGGGLNLTSTGFAQLNVTIQTSINLSNWTPLTAVASNVNSIRLRIDPKPATETQRFYRAIVR